MQIESFDHREQDKQQNHESKSKRQSHLPPAEDIQMKTRSASRTSSIGTIHDEIQETLRNLLMKQKELEHDQQLANDWRTTATKVDKILFYIFLFLTILSTVGLLVVVPFSRTNTQQKTKLWNGTRRP